MSDFINNEIQFTKVKMKEWGERSQTKDQWYYLLLDNLSQAHRDSYPISTNEIQWKIVAILKDYSWELAD